MAWSREDLDAVSGAQELEIASVRADGSLRRWLPIWAVVADGEVYVRTWYRRDTGWFGHVVASGVARIRVPGLESDVAVQDVGDDPAVSPGVDAAYRAKYAGGVDQMVSDAARATTLALIRRQTST